MRSYAAFISYSHSDEAFAVRLHRFIETWRTPRRLVGSPGRDGAVPGRLFPVFRDRDELPTSADLGGVIRQALTASKYLVVLCSPRSGKSRWVNEEILEFKRLHGEGRIIAAILDGEPEDCFPQALRFRMGTDGVLSDIPAEPVAADFRPGKDGWRSGTLKILAGLLGVNYDDLAQREARRRRTRRLTGATLASVAAAGLGLGAWHWSETERLRAVQADAQRGLSELRSGDVFAGAHRFISAVRDMDDAAPPEQLHYADALLARLMPLEEALAATGEGTLVQWRGKTLLRRGDGLVPIGQAGLYATTPTTLITADFETGLTGRDPETLDIRWNTRFDSGEEICDLWIEDASGRIYAEGRYIGMSGGSSYGFSGWVDPDTGAFDHEGFGSPGQRDCLFGDQPQFVEAGFTRIGRDVGPFDWPRLRREAAHWEPADLLPNPPPFLPDSAHDDVRRTFLTVDGRRYFGLDYLLVVRGVFACGGDDRFAIGLSSYGTSGGTWNLCRGDGDMICADYGFLGGINGYAVAPDCGMVAAWGVGLDDRRGLSIALPDLSIGRLENSAHTGLMDLGTFSPDGALFVATDGADRILVFERTPTGLSQLTTHETEGSVHALAFVAADILAFVTSRGALHAIHLRNGTPVWPAVALGEGVGRAVAAGDYFGDRPVTLLADPAGETLAFAVQLPSDEAWQLDPGLRPRRLDGTFPDPVPGEFETFAQFFDARLGLPLGRRMSLTWTTGRAPLEDLWENAQLRRAPDRHLSFSYAPHAAFVAAVPVPYAGPLERLTGYGAGGPLTDLP